MSLVVALCLCGAAATPLRADFIVAPSGAGGPAADPQAGLDRLEQALRERIEQKGKDPFLLHDLGTVLFRRGEVAEARKLWDEAAAREPNLCSSQVKPIFELLGAGDLAAAQAGLEQLLAERPDDPHVYLAQGDLAVRTRNPAAARQAFAKAHQLAPKLLPATLSLGRVLELAGDRQAAEAHYREATRLAPSRPEGWVLLASSQFNKDEIDQALDSLRRAEAADPLHPMAEARLAAMYLGINDLLSARRWYRAAVDREADDPVLRVALGQVELRLGRNDEAKLEFQAALKSRQYAPAVVSLGQLAHSSGDFESAVHFYRRAIELDPRSAVANNNLAMLLLRSGESASEALNLATVALEAAPESPAVQGTYACACFDAGRRQEAQAALRQALRRTPNDAWVRYAYGKLLCDEQRRDAAREHLEGCLIIDPEFPRKAEVLALLREAKP